MSIKIEGIKPLVKKLGKVAAAKTLEPAMERSVFRLQHALASYPAPIPDSPYRRTGTLGREWTTDVNRHYGGVRGTVGTNTEYAPWVQSQNFQAWMHKGRWLTDEGAIQKKRKDIIRDFEGTIRRALK